MAVAGQSSKPGAKMRPGPTKPTGKRGRYPVSEPSWERVAQSVEHVTFNHGVLGSSPSALTKNFVD